MAYENFPETEKTSTPAPQPAQKTNLRNLLTAFLLVALLGTWAYIIYDKNKTKETIQQKDTQLATSNTEKDVLRKELDDATMRYDMIKTSSADMAHSKDSVITQRDRDIAEKRVKIQQLLTKANATAAELAQAKTLIASLNDDITGYKTQIETLQGEKIVLTQQKEAVTKERDDARKETEDAKTVIKEKEDIIDIGSTLHASNFNIIGINEKKSGKEKTTTTAKRVDKLRISFDLDENRITQSGNKTLYICITAPSGTPVTVEALGSGTFKTRDGEDKFFTEKVEVNYTQGQRQTINVDWKQNSNFETGDYKIEVYNNGFKIGDGVRSFKKGGLFS
ncbi:zinc ribbon domain-containing protein [Ferruginibacter sp.]